jgi:mRNA interferase RelE/StbE
MYSIQFSVSARNCLKKVHRYDSKLYFRLMAAIEALAMNPFLGKVLVANLRGQYSLRVGDYRIIYSIFQKQLLVTIIDLGHRKEIYR